jgi:hypothetical protein
MSKKSLPRLSDYREVNPEQNRLLVARANNYDEEWLRPLDPPLDERVKLVFLGTLKNSSDEGVFLSLRGIEVDSLENYYVMDVIE